jgi:methionyl-tRNA formyltransferase
VRLAAIVVATSPATATAVEERTVAQSAFTRVARAARAAFEAPSLRPPALWQGPSWDDLRGRAGVPVLEPATWDDALPSLCSAEIVLMAGFPRMVPAEALVAPALGWVNFHPSLLPAYRGSHPLFWALYDCCDEAGVSAYVVTEELDAGPVVAREETKIAPEDTFESLYRRVIAGTPALVGRVVDAAERAKTGSSQIEAEPQRDVAETPRKAPRPEDLRVRWSDPAALLACRSRHLPRQLWFELDGRRGLLIESAVQAGVGKPGEILDVSAEGILVATGEGGLLLQRLDVEGVFTREAGSIARRLHLQKGAVL